MADRFEALYLGSIFNKKKTPPCCPLVTIQDSDTVTHVGLGTPTDPFIFTATGSGTPTVTTANSGLSLSGTTVQWGQTINQAGDPAKLLHATEVPMNGNRFVFKGIGGVGITMYDAGDIVFDDALHATAFGPGFRRGAGNMRYGNNTLGNTGVGATNLIALGDSAMSNLNSGQDSIAIGRNAMVFGGSMQFSIAIGFNALQQTDNGTGHIGIGVNSLFNSTTGTSNNTAIGFNAGHEASSTPLTGSNNTFIGAGAAFIAPANFSGGTAIGAGAILGKSNSVVLGKSGDQVGIGELNIPTARLHLPSGTATAGTAPLKITSGTLLTTAEDGAIEYDGTSFYGTVGTTRVPFGASAAGSTNDVQFNNAGALAADSGIFTYDPATSTLATASFNVASSTGLTFFGTSGSFSVGTGTGLSYSNGAAEAFSINNGVTYNDTVTGKSLRFTTTGGLGVNQAAPTAQIDVSAAAGTANTAPLRFRAGTLLGSPQDGTFEYDGTHLYFTIGTTRTQLL